jgi:hypothetical protein
MLAFGIFTSRFRDGDGLFHLVHEMPNVRSLDSGFFALRPLPSSFNRDAAD